MSLGGVGHPSGVVDIELSNVTLPGQTFGTGTMVSLTLKVPESYAGASEVMISAVPDTIADGFFEVASHGGQDFALTIIPEPGAITLACLAGVVGVSRRRRFFTVAAGARRVAG